MGAGHAQALLVVTENFRNALIQFCPITKHAIRKAHPDHRVLFAPVPAKVRCQTGEQRLVPFKQILQRVKQQALAKTPGAAQKIARTLFN